MERVVILHGAVDALVAAVGHLVATKFGWEVVDLRGVGDVDPRGVVAGATGRVVLVSQESLMARWRRVELVARGTVVRLVEKGGEVEDESGSGVGRGVWGEGHATVEVGGAGIVGAAEQVAECVAERRVVVAAGERSYFVEVGQGVWRGGLKRIVAGGTVGVVVTDQNVDGLYGRQIEEAVQWTGLRFGKVVVVPGEDQKRLETVEKVYAGALEGGLDRSSWVVGVGGGVVTDMAGFAAATWMRGIRWVALPTTLLAMVDASVGGKTGVDYGVGKNAVGAFWQPKGVVCDTTVLATEKERNFRGALAEVVKTAIIGDEQLMRILEEEKGRVEERDGEILEEIVRRSIEVKARIVGLDEREAGLRATLNLGHTVGHAFEAEDNFTRYNHGEAVSLGLVAALRLGVRLGRTPEGLVERVVALLRSYGLPVGIGPSMLERAKAVVGHDKKRAGSRIRFVFAEGMGKVVGDWLIVEDLREMMASLADG